MTNTVAITIKASGPSGSAWAAIKADAAKAGASAADAFNEAFTAKADARGTATERLKESGGLGGEDASLMNRLKGYANTPGGIGILGTGNDTSLMSMLKNQIRQMGESGGPGLLSGMSQGGGESTTDMVRQVLTNSVTGNTSSSDFIKQVLEGSGPSNTSTTDDIIKQVLEGATPGNVSTEDIIRRVVEGQLPGNTDTTDTIHEKIDDSAIKAQGEKDGDTYGTSFASAVKSKLSGLLGGGSGGAGAGIGSLLAGGSEGGGGDESAVAGALNSGGVAGGALPGVAGVSGMAATVTGLAGALVAVLPAITTVVGGLAGIGVGVGALAGGFALLDKTNKTFAADVTSTFSGMESVAAKAAAPLTGPLESALSQMGGLVKSIGPQLSGLFSASAGMIQPLVTGIKGLVTNGMQPLTALIKDATPLIAPLISGFQGLLSGAAPGFIAMVKAAGPVFDAVASSFTDLGKSLGTMFSDFASDGKGSATILTGFLDIINSLLPFIGELGKIMVSALAPAFSAFAGALSKVLPALSPLMSILGSFAGAVLSDLGSVLESLGGLLVGLAPSFTLLAKAASGVFTAMENDGVFASLGNAIEGLAAPLAGLINALVKALLPALPGIIAAFSKFANIFTGALVTVLSGLANALTAIIKAIPQPVLTALVDGFVAWYAAGKLLAPVLAAINLAMDANPIVLVAAAVAILAGAFYLAWEKSATFRDIIKDIGSVMVTMAIGVVTGAKYVTDAILNMVGDALHAIAPLANVPGFGWIRTAVNDFDGMKTHVNNAFNDMLNTLNQWKDGLSGAASTAHDLTGKMNTDFGNQQKAAENAKTGIDDLTDAIKTNGVNSDQAKQARQQLITDLENAGIKAGTAKTDVDNYTDAVKNNGIDSQQAAAARQKLISDILAASNNAVQGKTDLNNYTTAVETNGTKSDAAKAARAQLITDLENAGLNAQTANNLVDGLTNAIKNLPSKTVDIHMNGQGLYTITGSVIAASQGSGGSGNAAGGLATGGFITGGTPGKDSVLGMLMPGELVIPTWMVNSGAVDHLRGILPGFASGGAVGGNLNAGYVTGMYGTYQDKMTASMVAAMRAALSHAEAVAVAAAKAAAASNSGGPGGGDPSANAALAKKLYPAWSTGLLWTDWNNVAMRESGWSNTIWNAQGSPAYGIAQADPWSKYPKAGWPPEKGGSANPTAQIGWMHDYMESVYGGPAGAWASEVNRGFYDNGGWLKPGYTLAYNGTGSPEPVGGGAGGNINITLEVTGSGNGAFDAVMLQWLRQQVRIKGGGNVQAALGRP